MEQELLLILGGAGGYIIKILEGALRPYFTQKAVPKLLDRLRARRHRVKIDSLDRLSEVLNSGDVVPGDLIEGSALFSSYSVSHLSSLPLPFQAANVVNQLLRPALQSAQISMPITEVLPTSRFPLVHDDFRVGFLYPPTMWGFGVPMSHDGTSATLPWICAHPIIVPTGQYDSLDNTVVRYRARVHELPISLMRTIVPQLTDDEYEDLRRRGQLSFLSVDAEDVTWMRHSAPRPHDTIVGSCFLELHWEDEEVYQAGLREFTMAVDKGIKAACGTIGARAPEMQQYTKEGFDKANIWYGNGFGITQSRALPYLSIQMSTDLSDPDTVALHRNLIEQFTRALTDTIGSTYELPAEKDINGITGFRPASFTLLKSTAARTIDHPILKAVRDWLSTKSGTSLAKQSETT